MRSLRYLNTILTILTVLLALQIWTAWTAPAPGSDRSVAQALPLVSQAQAAGIPNAGQQRKQMIDLLKQQSQKADELINLLTSGEVRVRIATSPDEAG